MKICSICLNDLDESRFSKDRVTKDGYRPRCKDCESKRRKELILERGGKVHVYRREDKEGFKTCSSCKQEKEHSEFYNCSITKDGLGSSCKLCSNDYTKKQYHNPKNRAVSLCAIYKRVDFKKGIISDLTSEFIEQEIICKPCYYCGDIKSKIGCDRIDNDIGHLKNNVVPCCYICNSVKSDKFSEKEMLELGRIISKIKNKRNGGTKK